MICLFSFKQLLICQDLARQATTCKILLSKYKKLIYYNKADCHSTQTAGQRTKFSGLTEIHQLYEGQTINCDQSGIVSFPSVRSNPN